MAGVLDAGIVFLCACGVFFSCYAIYIARGKTLDENFEASCDIDETISCTSALLSEYSNGFGIVGKILGEDHFLNLPNSYMGLIFFPVLLVLSLSSSSLLLQVAISLSLVSTVISAYLIYVLVYVLETICLVCLPVHFINILLLLLFTLKGRSMASTTSSKRPQKSKSAKKRHKKD